MVLLAGDAERGRAIRLLQRAYAGDYLDASELDSRVELALSARTVLQLGMSVRGIPGALVELLVEGVAVPAVRYGTLGMRLRLGRLLLRVALRGWMLTTAVLGLVAALWALTAGISAGVGIALALVWLAASGGAYFILRSARRLSQP